MKQITSRQVRKSVAYKQLVVTCNTTKEKRNLVKSLKSAMNTSLYDNILKKYQLENKMRG